MEMVGQQPEIERWRRFRQAERMRVGRGGRQGMESRVIGNKTNMTHVECNQLACFSLTGSLMWECAGGQGRKEHISEATKLAWIHILGPNPTLNMNNLTVLCSLVLILRPFWEDTWGRGKRRRLELIFVKY
jgi:hypothetical protein